MKDKKYSPSKYVASRYATQQTIDETQYLKEAIGKSTNTPTEEVEAYKRLIENGVSITAPFRRAEIGAIPQLGEGTRMIIENTVETEKRKEFIEPIQEKKKIYSVLLEGMANMFQEKSSSGQGFMLKTVNLANSLAYSFNELTKSSVSPREAVRSIERLREGKPIVTFDLETFGGKNIHGVQDLDMITEFAFAEFDQFSKKSFQRGPTSTTQGFVGIDPSEVGKVREVIKKFTEAPESLTVKDKVTINYLAKLGDERMVVEEVSDGRFHVKSSPSMEDVEVTADNVERGFKESQRIGARQAATINPATGLKGWQEDLAQGMSSLMKEENTVVSYNGKRADIPWLKQASAMYGDKFTNYLSSLTGKSTFDVKSKNHVDLFGILSNAQTDPKFANAYLSPELLAIAQEGGHTINQLETLSKATPGRPQGQGAHTALIDSMEGVRVALYGKVGNESLLNSMYKANKKLIGSTIGSQLRDGRNQLFQAQRGLGQFGLGSAFGFRIDPYTGNYLTTDGYTINPDSGETSYSSKYKEYLTRKDLVYTIDEIVELSPDNTHAMKYVEEMKKVNPALAVNELMLMRISGYTEEGDIPGRGAAGQASKLSQEAFIFGTKEELQRIMNENFLLFAERNDRDIQNPDGTVTKGKTGWNEVKGARKKLERVAVSPTGESITVEQPNNLVKDVVNSGIDHSTAEDITSRLRKMDANFFQRTIALANEIDESIIGGTPRDASSIQGHERQKKLLELLENSKANAQKIANGEVLAQDAVELNNTIQRILGVDLDPSGVGLAPDGTKGLGFMNSKTADLVLSTLDQARAISPVVNDIISTINSVTNEKDPAMKKDILFKQAMGQAMDTIIARTPNVILPRAKDVNYFEFELSRPYGKSSRTTPVVGFDALNQVQKNPNVLRVGLGKGDEYKLVRSLTGGEGTDREARKKVFQLMQETGYANIVMGNLSPQEFINRTEASSMASMFINQLRAERQASPNMGYVTIPSTPGIINVKDTSALVNNLDDRKNLMAPIIESIKTNANNSFISLPKVMQSSDGMTNLAGNIVDNFLMKSFDQQQLKGMGHDEKSIKLMQRTRDVRRKEYVALMENILAGASKINATLDLDQATGEMTLISNGKAISLSDYLPKEVTNNGITYFELGRGKFSVGMTMGSSEGANGKSYIGLQSAITNAVEETGWGRNLAVAVAAKQRVGGDGMDTIATFLSKFSGALRENAAIDNLSEKDLAHQYQVDFSRIFDQIGKLDLSKTGMSPEEIKELKSHFKDGNRTFAKAGDSVKSTIFKYQNEILRLVANNSDEFVSNPGNDIGFIVNNGYLSNRQKGKALSEGKVQLAMPQIGVEAFSSPARVFERSADYVRFQEEKARAILSNSSISDSVYLGADARTAVGIATSATESYGMRGVSHSEVTAKRLHIGSVDFERQVRAHAKSIGKEHLADIILTANTIYEGSMVASSKMGDAILQNYDRQYISAQREVIAGRARNISHIKELKEMIRDINNVSKVVPEFELDDQGRIVFSYKKGVAVKRGEHILTEYDSYGGTKGKITAKSDGALQYGFFTNTNELADERSVIAAVYEHAKKINMNIADEEAFLQVAGSIYQKRFYVETLEKSTYRKGHEGRSEKGMTRFAYQGVGSSNAQVRDVLDLLGLESLQGKVLNDKFYDDLASGNVHNSVLAQFSNLKSSIGDFDEAIKISGFGSREEFSRALYEERHELSTFLEDAFKQETLLADGTTKTDVPVLFSQGADEKHGNRGRILSDGLSNMREHLAAIYQGQGMDRDSALAKAAEEVVGKVNASGAVIGAGGAGLSYEGGNILTPQFDHFQQGGGIDNAKLKAVYEGVVGQGTYESIMSPGQISSVSFGIAHDYTGTTGAGDMRYVSTEEAQNAKGYKFSQRDLTWMESAKIQDDVVQKARERLTPELFAGNFGHLLDPEGNVSEAYKGKSFFEPIKDVALNRIYNQPQDKSGVLIDSNGNWMSDDEGDNYLRKSAEGFKKLEGATGAISRRTAKIAHEFNSNTAAISYNNEDITKEQLLSSEFGFVERKLSDLDFKGSGDASYFTGPTAAATSVYDQATLVDLSEIDDEILRDANVSNSSLAIGRLGVQKVGEELIVNEPQKLLGDVQREHNLWIKAQDNPDYTAEQRSGIRTRLVEALSGFNQSLSTFNTGKESAFKKELTEMRMDKSSTSKVGLMVVQTGENVEHIQALENAKIDGISIADHYRAGRAMDFRLASRKSLEAMGLFGEEYMRKVFKDYDSHVDDLIPKMEELLKGGVQAVVKREPLIYEGSQRVATMIYAPELKDGVLDSAAGAISGKADADGDQVAAMLARYIGSNGQEIDAIEHALAQNKDAIAEKEFRTLQSRQYVNAVVTNQYYQGVVDDSMADIEKLKEKISLSSDMLTAKSADGNLARPELSYFASEELEKKYQKSFAPIEEAAVSNYRERFTDGTTFEDARLMLRSDKDYDKLMKSAMEQVVDQGLVSRELAAEALDYSTHYTSAIAQLAGGNKQAAAGQLNLPMFKVRRIRSMMGADMPEQSTKDRLVFNHILEAAEEAFLTPKHNEGKIVDNVLAASEFNQAFNSLTGRGNKIQESSTDLMVQWFEKNLPGRFKSDKIRELGDGPNLAEMSAEDRTHLFRNIAEEMQSYFKEFGNLNKLDLSMSVFAQTQAGVSVDSYRESLAYSLYDESLQSRALQGIANGSENSNIKSVELLSSRELVRNTNPDHAISQWAPPTTTNADILGEAKGVIAEAQQKMGEMRITSKQLAIGAVGIAGATMLAGFVGGNPSTPAVTQASDQSSSYGPPLLTDDATAMMQANPSQGYIININAGTEKGVEHAQQAIRQAMATSMNSTNVNVAMNINNNSGNITDSTIERMVSGFLGF